MQELNYSSYPPQTSAGSGANPFQAYVDFAADTTLALTTGNPEADSCRIDPQTRQTLDDPGVCSLLVGRTIYGINGVFLTRQRSA